MGYIITWIFQVCKICAEIHPKKTYQKAEILHIWKIQVLVPRRVSPQFEAMQAMPQVESFRCASETLPFQTCRFRILESGYPYEMCISSHHIHGRYIYV